MTDAYLVDTNIIVWSWHEPDRLPKRYSDILNSSAQLYVSVASVWEIAIKSAIGKLVTVPKPAQTLIDMGYVLLPIAAEHAEATAKLPLHHRDPFDRLLIAQAMALDMPMLATDRWFSKYDVEIA